MGVSTVKLLPIHGFIKSTDQFPNRKCGQNLYLSVANFHAKRMGRCRKIVCHRNPGGLMVAAAFSIIPDFQQN